MNLIRRIHLNNRADALLPSCSPPKPTYPTETLWCLLLCCTAAIVMVPRLAPGDGTADGIASMHCSPPLKPCPLKPATLALVPSTAPPPIYPFLLPRSFASISSARVLSLFRSQLAWCSLDQWRTLERKLGGANTLIKSFISS
jgi:hypothetical protein